MAIHFPREPPHLGGWRWPGWGGGGGGERDSQPGPHLIQVRRAALSWECHFSGILCKDKMSLSTPSSLSEAGHCHNPPPLSHLTSGWGGKRAFLEKKQEMRQAETPVPLLTAGATAGQSHPPHLPERPLCTLQANPGSEGSSGSRPGQGGKKRKSLYLSMGKQAEGQLPPWKLHQALQTPTLKLQGPLPFRSFKMEGPETPPSGAAVATARRQP